MRNECRIKNALFQFLLNSIHKNGHKSLSKYFNYLFYQILHYVLNNNFRKVWF